LARTDHLHVRDVDKMVSFAVDFMKVPVNFSLGSSLAAPKAMEFTRAAGMAVRILAAPLAAKNLIFSSRSISNE